MLKKNLKGIKDAFIIFITFDIVRIIIDDNNSNIYFALLLRKLFTNATFYFDTTRVHT